MANGNIPRNALDLGNIMQYLPLLQKQGLLTPQQDAQIWSPGENGLGNFDFSNLAGFQAGQSEQPGGMIHSSLFDPQGNEVQNYDYAKAHESMTGRDWWHAALAMAGPAAIGAGLGAMGIGPGIGAAFPGFAGAAEGAALGGGAVDAGMGLGGAAEGLGGITGGSGLTASGSSLYAPTGFAGGTGSALSGASSGGGGGFLSGLGSLFSGGSGGMTPGNWMQLGQGALGLYGNSRAISAAQDATNSANQTAQGIYNQQRADNMPLMQTRDGALAKINALLADPSSVAKEPGYEFGRMQGQRQLDNNAAASGNYYSGGQQKAAARYNSDYASTKFDQSLNRLTNLAGLGQVGANNNQNALASFGQQQSQNALNMGNFRGSGYAGSANTIGNALGNVAQDWQVQNYLANMPGGGR